MIDALCKSIFKEFKEINTFIQQGCVRLIIDIKTLLEKISILNMLFFLTFYSSKNPEKSITGSKHIKILSSTTVFNIDKSAY